MLLKYRVAACGFCLLTCRRHVRLRAALLEFSPVVAVFEGADRFLLKVRHVGGRLLDVHERRDEPVLDGVPVFRPDLRVVAGFIDRPKGGFEGWR